MDDLKSVVMRAQAGDIEAFTRIVQRFQDMAVGYASAILGDVTLAEDATQEALLEVYRCLPALREPNAFPSWLRKIVFKHCDRLTRSKQLATVPLELVFDAAADQRDLPTHVEQQEICDQIHRIVQELPADECTVITLFYISDYAHKEIAAFLELPLATVNNRLRSARKRLKQRMMEMTQDNWHELRPSKDSTFADRVMEMLRATMQGDTAHVTTLLEREASLLHAAGPVDYWSIPQAPLHVAVTNRDRAMIDHLLRMGADINASDQEGQKPIHLALGVDQSLVDFLIDRGAAVDIFAAASLGDFNRVQALLADDPGLAQARGPEGATPLHVAQTVEIAQLLLDHGADINALDSYTRRPPIGWAAGGAPVREFLLAKGARVDNILLACRIGDIGRIKRFLEADPTLLHAKTAAWDDHGGDATLLHIAAAKGGPALVQFLLENGLDPNSRGGWWRVTPLHWAVEKAQNRAVVQLLIDHGADVNARSGEKGIAPLHWAAHMAYMELMVEHGAEVNARADDGATPLHSAARRGKVEMVRFLLEHGADPHAQENETGATPLDWAQHHENESVVAILMEYGTLTM